MDSNQRNAGLGIALIILGAFFLLTQFVDINLGRYGWPFLIIVPGLLLLAGATAGGPSAAPPAIPGSIVITIGIIFFYQNLTDSFETWSYAWALIPTSVGVGMIIQGTVIRNDSLKREGSQLARTFLFVFLAFAVFFEFIIGIGDDGGRGLGRIVGPLLLIAGGAYLLLRGKSAQECSSPAQAPLETEE